MRLFRDPGLMKSAERPTAQASARTIAALPSYYQVLLVAHIILAVSLVLPSILLPFALRTRRATTESESRVVRWLLWAQTRPAPSPSATGLALTGIGLIAALGSTMLQQPWLLVALTIYFINLGIAFFVQRPEPAPAHRRPRRRRQRPGWRGPAGRRALRVVPDGGARGHDRLPHELETGALVTCYSGGGR